MKPIRFIKLIPLGLHQPTCLRDISYRSTRKKQVFRLKQPHIYTGQVLPLSWSLHMMTCPSDGAKFLTRHPAPRAAHTDHFDRKFCSKMACIDDMAVKDQETA